MNTKHEEVQLWLEKVFEGDDVPGYELNSTTINLLHDLMRKNQASDADTALIVQDLNQKADEYNAEAKRLEHILQRMNLSLGSLSQAGVISLKLIANVVLLLQTKDSSDTGILLALQHLCTEQYEVEEARKAEENHIKLLTEQTKSALIKQSHLKRALEVLEQKKDKQCQVTEKRSKDLEFIIGKAKEYKEKIRQLQSALKKLGADPSLYHSNLVDKSEGLKKLQEKLQPLQTKLQMYKSLPPDVSSVKVKIQELKETLASLEAEINQRIDVMHL